MWKRIRCGKLLLCCGVLGGARHFGAHRGRRGAGHIVAAARLQLVVIITRSCDGGGGGGGDVVV